MCLETITTRIEKPLKKTMFAWQIFSTGPRGGLYSSFFNNKVRIGRWERATNLDRLSAMLDKAQARVAPITCYCYAPYSGGEKDLYMPGFHCSRTRADAREYARKCGCTGPIRRVKIRYVHTIGRQEGFDVLVARDRMVIPLKGDKR